MKVPEAASLRARIPDANDGIVATAGVIQGFLAAGAGSGALLTASLAVTVAGAASLAGIKYSETAAERDAQGVLIAEELAKIRQRPEAEMRELAQHYQQRGVEPSLAMEVARQISAHDALTAQLEVEHHIHERMPASAPLVNALAGGLAFVVGAALPITITIVAPDHLRAIATVAAVFVSLALTGWVAARVLRSNVWRAVSRGVLIGVIALGLSVLAGSFLPDPDGAARGTEQEYFPDLP